MESKKNRLLVDTIKVFMPIEVDKSFAFNYNFRNVGNDGLNIDAANYLTYVVYSNGRTQRDSIRIIRGTNQKVSIQ